jgi:hypothetical protein
VKYGDNIEYASDGDPSATVTVIESDELALYEMCKSKIINVEDID